MSHPYWPSTIRWLGRDEWKFSVILTLRLPGGQEIAVGRAIELDNLADDEIERIVKGDLLRDFLRTIHDAHGVKTLRADGE